jgi:succinoglycan biosynthesis protein ExoM
MGVDVSICIATYRRPEGLARLLASLERMKPPAGLRIEVVVVDNDPDPRAAETSREQVAGAALPTEWLHEPRRNIAHARNAGVARCTGTWIAFVDDDEVVGEDWLVAYSQAVQRLQCDGCFGPVIPRAQVERRTWLDVDTFYARPRHPTGTRLVRSGTRTSNALLRRSWLGEAPFDPRFGRSGGSDVELFGRLLARGADLRWCDEALVYEFVPPARHRVGWLMQRAFRGGCVVAWIEQNERGTRGSIRRVGRAGCALAGYSLAALGMLVAGRRAALRPWLRACVQAGRLYAYGGGWYEEYAE